MAKPDGTPLADALLGHARRGTTTLLLRSSESGMLSASLDYTGAPIPGSEPVELRGGLLRRDPEPKPKPDPDPAPEPPPAAEAPDPRDDEIRFYRQQAARAAEVGRELDQHGRDLRWLTTFGTKAPRFEP